MKARVDLLQLLQQIEDYVLIKLDVERFPNYPPGSDVDLVVYDREEAVKRIHGFYERMANEQATLRITDTNAHCHADFLFSDTLELRIDLIDNFNFLKNLALKPAYMTKLFKDRRPLRIDGSTVFVPSPEDDLMLRYVEYLEWFDRRPDKIKHLDYVGAVADEDLKQRFFANTHRFIQFKRKTWADKYPDPSTNAPIVSFKSRKAALQTAIYSSRFLIVDTLRRWKSRVRRRLSSRRQEK